MANTFLSRSNSSGTSTQKGTISVWIKGSEEPSGNNQTTLACWGNANNHGALIWNGGDKIDAFDYQSGYASQLQTNALLRDSSAWYHIVYAWDTTLSTANDRQKIYINGIEQTYSTRTNYSTNAATSWNANSYSMRVGGLNSSSYFNGLMSHIHFIDGIAYAPTLFGETDSTTGQWKIKTSPSVTYGNNGFFVLKDGITITDSSPNSNNFAVTGGTLTKTEDSPSNNFATLNPLVQGTSNNARTFANGNNTITLGRDSAAISSLGVTSGKYYCEIKCVTDAANPVIGIAKEGSPATVNPWGGSNLVGTNEYGYVSDGKKKGNAGSFTNYGSTWTTGDIISIAYNATIGAIWFGKNGTWQNNATDAQIAAGTTTYAAFTGLSGLFFFGCCDAATPTGDKFSSNFGNGYFGTTAVSSAGTNASGNGIFEYNVPAGFTALSTKGLNL